MENFSVMEGSLKNLISRGWVGGGFMRNQYMGGITQKGGSLDSLQV